MQGCGYSVPSTDKSRYEPVEPANTPMEGVTQQTPSDEAAAAAEAMQEQGKER